MRKSLRAEQLAAQLARMLLFFCVCFVFFERGGSSPSLQFMLMFNPVLLKSCFVCTAS